MIGAPRRLWCLAVVLLVAVGLGACSSTQVRLPPRAKLLAFEKIHSKIRTFASLREGRTLASCNGLVFVGRSYPAPGTPSTDFDEIEIADGPAVYLDNRSGRKVADCSYWYCVKNSALCNARCPLPEWTCHGIDFGVPATREQELRSAIGIIKRPTKPEMRTIEEKLRLPDTAPALTSYFRYYYAIPEAGQRHIVGRFIATHLMPNIRKSEGDEPVVVDDDRTIPKVAGSGCDVVDLKYDPRDRVLMSVGCAGT